MSSSVRQFVSFWIENDVFGIDILLLREINRNVSDLTPVDQAPEYIRGLLNLRGQIVTVVDTGMRLGFGPIKITPQAGCIVLKTNKDLAASKTASQSAQDSTSNDLVGLLVDKIGDVVTVESYDVEKAPVTSGGLNSRFLEGVIKLKNNLLVTLNVKEIIAID